MGRSSVKYSVNDVDYMRALVRLNLQYGPYVEGWYCGYGRYTPSDELVELHLNTYMRRCFKPNKIRKVIKKRIKKAKAFAENSGMTDQALSDYKQAIDDVEYILREYDAVYRNK